jgi:DNA-binding XRE family transcriptional regulator
MEQTMISRETLAQRWDLTTRTVINYEAEGVITRNPNIPVPRYSMNEILKLEGADLNPLSPLERRRLNKQIEDLEKELNFYKDKFTNIKMLMT